MRTPGMSVLRAPDASPGGLIPCQAFVIMGGMYELIDTHAHLNDPKYDDDRQACLTRARENGVAQIVNIGSGYGFASNQRSLELAREHAGVFSTVGLHPHEADQWTQEIEDQLTGMAADRKVVAVGEIGLDYFYENSPVEVQHETFRKMIRLALRLNKPVVIHNRDAHADTERILREEGQGVLRGVIHSFTGDPPDAERFVKLGFYISIPGIVTFKKATNVQASARMIPPERLLVETDSPYLTPIPFRGRRNEPAYVRYTLEYIAQERGVDPAELAAITTQNARHLFSLPPTDLISMSSR
jgi:TatD DNase family protein